MESNQTIKPTAYQLPSEDVWQSCLYKRFVFKVNREKAWNSILFSVKNNQKQILTQFDFSFNNESGNNENSSKNQESGKKFIRKSRTAITFQKHNQKQSERERVSRSRFYTASPNLGTSDSSFRDGTKKNSMFLKNLFT